MGARSQPSYIAALLHQRGREGKMLGRLAALRYTDWFGRTGCARRFAISDRNLIGCEITDDDDNRGKLRVMRWRCVGDVGIYF